MDHSRVWITEEEKNAWTPIVYKFNVKHKANRASASTVMRRIVNSNREYCISSYFLGIAIYDRFLCEFKANIISRVQGIRYAAVCLGIAVKYEEDFTYFNYGPEIQRMTNSTLNKLLDLELIVLNTIQWKIPRATAYSYAMYYAQEHKELTLSDINNLLARCLIERKSLDYTSAELGEAVVSCYTRKLPDSIQSIKCMVWINFKFPPEEERKEQEEDAKRQRLQN